MAETSIVTITEYWLSMIKKAIAYPAIDEVVLQDDEIKSYCIYPALRDYFSKFPLRDTQEYTLTSSSEVEIAFPDTNTFGVLDVRVVGKEMISGQGSSFWDIAYYNTMGMSHLRGGSYNIPKYNPNFRKQAVYLQKMAISSLSNEATTHVRVEEENKKVYIYHNGTGKANIKWAKFSSDFDNVRFVYKNDVVKLAQAYLKLHISEIAGLLHSNLEITIDSDTLRSEGKEMKQEVMDRWVQIPDPMMLRST